MIDPTTVAFDIDGVVADTMNLFLAIAREEYRINNIRYEDMTCYSLEECLHIDPPIIDAILAKILDGSHRPSLKPMEGAGEVLSRVAACRNPLVFVTARSHAGLIGDWIRDSFSFDAEAIEVVATGMFEAKVEVLLEKGFRYFVEDRLETCFQMSGAGLEPVVFSQPWNRREHPFMEVRNWSELGNLIAF